MSKGNMADQMPARPARAAPRVTAPPATGGEAKPINVRMEAGRARYLRMLSAHSGRSQKELLEQAVDLLREAEGDV